MLAPSAGSAPAKWARHRSSAVKFAKLQSAVEILWSSGGRHSNQRFILATLEPFPVATR